MSGIWVQVSEFRHRWYPSEEAYRNALGEGVNKSAYVQDDTMPPLEHFCDGNFYDSKSKYREVTKAHGCIEVGNDLLSKQPDRQHEHMPKNEVRAAIYKALRKHGHKPD